MKEPSYDNLWKNKFEVLATISIGLFFALFAFYSSFRGGDDSSDAFTAGMVFLGLTLVLGIASLFIPGQIKRTKTKTRVKILTVLKAKEIRDNLYEVSFKGHKVLLSHILEFRASDTQGSTHLIQGLIEIPNTELHNFRKRKPRFNTTIVEDKAYAVFLYNIGWGLNGRKFYKKLNLFTKLLPPPRRSA